MRNKVKFMIVGGLLLAAPIIALAQEDCAAIFREALDTAKTACSAVARNQICYGAGKFSAEARPGYEGMEFNHPGDMVDATVIQSLSMHTDTDSEWNLAIAKLQVNLPENQPEQTLTVLLMGNIEVENMADLVTPAGAFRFSSGIGSGSCGETLPNGLLLQTPGTTPGLDNAILTLNGAQISLRAAAWIRSGNLDDDWQPELVINVFEQGLEVTVEDMRHTISENMTVRILEDQEGWTWGEPVIQPNEPMADLLADTLIGFELRDIYGNVPQ